MRAKSSWFNDFMNGFGGALDFYGVTVPDVAIPEAPKRKLRPITPADSAKALRQDWENVWSDFRTTFSAIEECAERVNGEK